SSLLFLHSFPTRRSSDLSSFGLRISFVIFHSDFVISLGFVIGHSTTCANQVDRRPARTRNHDPGLAPRRGTFRRRVIRSPRRRRSEEHTSELQSRSDLVC